jgi:mono/diheme cytochrome c family protein
MSLRPFLLALAPLVLAAEQNDGKEFFETRVRPVLAKNCFSCHTSSRMGGLEMKSRESLIAGGKSGPAIAPGDPDQSLLIQAVRQIHAKLKMPPQGKLSDAEISDLAAWVKSGAVWGDPAVAPPSKGEYTIRPEQREFWSFKQPVKPELPGVRDHSWPKSPIDRFILSKLESKGLKPVRTADRSDLIRRAYFDLIGLPPKADDVDAFVSDKSPEAFAKVVDRLLASPQYGERWARHWLDIARYSDDKLDSTKDDPYPNAFRYRDWVIKAFNEDMPYDTFIKAQIAGDLMSDHAADMVGGLGLYGLSPEFQDDRVDVTTRGFMALTVACAQCHNHKFDPIPQKDYLSLSGIFNRTRRSEWPLAPKDVVDHYQNLKKRVDDQEELINNFIEKQSDQLAEILASSAARYIVAARKVIHVTGAPATDVARAEKLDAETLERWVKYLGDTNREHQYLNNWDSLERGGGSDATFLAAAEEFQRTLVSIFREKKSIDEQNLIRLGGSKDRRTLTNADLLSLAHDKYLLWRDFFQFEYRVNDPYRRPDGFLHYGDGKIDRFLNGEWKAYLEGQRAELTKLKRELPEQYPYYHVIADNAGRGGRGGRNGFANSGTASEEVDPHFLAILCDDKPATFKAATARLELANEIASPRNPLTARVIANRVWMLHFGAGLVRTPSNFGQLGDRPSHPELLDYLALRLIENKWSLKALHREIVLSAVYALSAEDSVANREVDPENRLLWRANRRRLDAESVRDAMLAVSGQLEAKAGGQPQPLDHSNRRTVYCFVSRRLPDPAMALFDFPNPNSLSEQRVMTSTPLQGLFLLNSDFVAKQSAALASRLQVGGDDAARMHKIYQSLFYRQPTPEELRLGLDYLRKAGGQAWERYAQVLLTSNEFLYVN